MNKIYILCITWIDDYIYIHILYEYRNIFLAKKILSRYIISNINSFTISILFIEYFKIIVNDYFNKWNF